MTVSYWINQYLNQLENGKKASKYTLKNYSHYLDKFLSFSGDVDVSTVDLNMTKRYKLHLAKSFDPIYNLPFKKSTQNYFLIALRSFIRYLNLSGILNFKHSEIKLFTQKIEVPRPLGIDSCLKLINSVPLTKVDGLRDRVILELFVSTGLKVSELAGLNRDDIDQNALELTIKNKKSFRKIKLLEGTLNQVRLYLNHRKDTFKPLFIRFQGVISNLDYGEKMRLTPRSVERIVAKYSKKANLETSVTPSILRHTKGVGLLNQGESLKKVQLTLGHSNLASTFIYRQVQKN